MDLTWPNVAAYVVAAFLVALGVRAAPISPLGGVLLVVAGLFATPLVRWRLRTRFDLAISRSLAAALVLLWVVVGLGLLAVATIG